jgi:SPP1 gp7 family putative phage head morphogenesis protein
MATATAFTIYTVARYDPTRTLMLRTAFANDLNRRFNRITLAIRRAIIDQDVFGFSQERRVLTQADIELPGRFAFDFPRLADKVTAFMAWLEKQVDLGILEILGRTQLGRAIELAWFNKYIQSAYQRGILRGRQELRNAGYDVPTIETTGGINVTFNQPFHLDRVGLVYTRAYSELKGITAIMDQQISRVLAQAMAEGRNPREIARLLVRTISGPVGDLGITDTLGRFIPAQRRAQILARTEIIRAHHIATINEYRNWGIAGVTVKAEWITAEDERVCEECAPLQNQIFSLDEIESMIPYHPQCRCVAIPVDITEEVQNANATSR